MTTLSDALARQPRLQRFICHLHQRRVQRRLNLVVGAGTSVDAKVPSWIELLDRLVEKFPDFKADFMRHRDSRLNPDYLGQIIFHWHREASPVTGSPRLREATLNHNWAQSIYDAIYRDVPKSTDPSSIEKIISAHPYLAQLRDFCRKVPLVINFNFDDILSDAIGQQIKTENIRGDGFAVTWDPPLVDRPETTTIYHVNGILPRVHLKKRSPELIFTEDSFAAALARAPGVSEEYLFLRFVQNTMLLIGVSLSDASLKHHLRRNKNSAPANHHYMIQWLETPNALSDRQRKDIFDANLELYNLITIFLTSSEIGELFALLNRDERDLRDFLDDAAPDKRHRYHYYIAGPVASGKSTLLEQLRCFSTHEEWTRPPPRQMYLKFDKLSDDEVKLVDTFVYSELKEKNIRMQDAGIGFHFMDRAPLDLYVFSKNDDDNKRKTKDLRDIVTRDKPFQLGEIVFISASGEELVNRNLRRGRDPTESGTVEYFDKQLAGLTAIYQPSTVIRTDQESKDDIARRVARKVLLGEYEPTDLTKIMGRYE